jgi:hypothetical protein
VYVCACVCVCMCVCVCVCVCGVCVCVCAVCVCVHVNVCVLCVCVCACARVVCACVVCVCVLSAQKVEFQNKKLILKIIKIIIKSVFILQSYRKSMHFQALLCFTPGNYSTEIKVEP